MTAIRQVLSSQELHRFLIVGAANVVLCYSTYLIALMFAPRAAAYTIAFLVGICFTTVANVRFAFDRKLTLQSLSVYAAYYCAYWLASLLLLEILVKGAGVPERLGPAAVLPLSVPLHYVFSRLVLRRFQESY
ncbi:GtrA family protein [Microvirga sp. BT689]|uniref:GtrA family protein n=1 Tax=Microvirga arvi TaxID=2778731 RepID=UPI00194FF134|nr:GtrA family protein [Microvirga arvi]MBM6583768.1 GtrA family protein [Microvirga arvi]